MITHHSTFSFICGCGHSSKTVEAKTLRTAIRKVRADHWDVLRVRAVSGVPKKKIARTVLRCYCPGCASSVGVTFR